ncbi:hypothetical protein CBS9595_001696 [Malassezia furfur]|nr:hypothetical protein CBS9595_001696 [Malassezia furfur]
MAAGASPAVVQEDAQRMPEVLLVCLVHDSAALRAQWSELDEGALGPLFFALSALQRDSRLLVGGVVYRSEPSSDLDALVRPYESIERITFLPATRFCARIKESLQSSEASQRLQLDAPSETEAPLADALAAALEMLRARDPPKHIAPFARAALRANFSPVLAKHVVHVFALERAPDALPIRISSQMPMVNVDARFDRMPVHDLITDLNQRSVSITTVLSTREGNARARSATARSAHELLSTHSEDQNVDVHELLGAQWKPPPHVEILVTGAEVVQALQKEARTSNDAIPKPKRTRTNDSPMTTASMPPTAKADPALFNKLMLLQQQQSTMLKNLTQIASAQDSLSGQTGRGDHAAGTNLQGQMLEQIRQQLLVQQGAIKRQAELLQSGKQPNLDPILQSLINIDKEAREASIHLGGPSSMLSQVKPAPAASAVPAPGAPPATNDAKPRAFWQGLIKWGSSGQNDDNMFTLVVASAMHFQAVQHSLALPWPNLMSISAFVPAAPNVLQQLITSRRVPCALLSLRPFPPNMAIRGAENNEQNYRMLAATLLQNQRAAYIPHGEPNCGLLLASVARRSGGAPQLLALVFQTPIPLNQLAVQPSGSMTANTRGMISVPQPQSIPTPTTQPTAFPTQDPLAASHMAPVVSNAFPPAMPAAPQGNLMSQLFGNRSMPEQPIDPQSALIQNLLGQAQSASAQASNHASWPGDPMLSMNLGL